MALGGRCLAPNPGPLLRGCVILLRSVYLCHSYLLSIHGLVFFTQWGEDCHLQRKAVLRIKGDIHIKAHGTY